MTKLKTGPKPHYALDTEVEFLLDPLKLSSFKSIVSKFNRGKLPENRLTFKFETYGKRVRATRTA